MIYGLYIFNSIKTFLKMAGSKMKKNNLLKVLIIFIYILYNGYNSNIFANDDINSTLAGLKSGLVIHLNCADAQKTISFQKNNIIVQGLDTSNENINAARQFINSKNLSGKISIEKYDGKNLPYIDNLINIIIADTTTVPNEEIIRILQPSGIAYINGQKIIKPWPQEIDQWTHYLYNSGNNAVSKDKEIGPPRHMQYLSYPLWTRHHDKLASISTVVTAKGLIFYIADEGPYYFSEKPSWSVTARDAFNGLFLWKKEIKSWTSITRKFRNGPMQLQRLLVTDGDRVFTTLGLNEPVSVLDAKTGNTVKTLTGTENTEEIILHNGILLIQIGTFGAEQALLEKNNPNIDYKTTKQILAVQPDTGKILWRWPSSKTATILPRSLAASDDKVFLQDAGSCVCLDFNSGKQIWETPIFSGYSDPYSAPKKKKKPDRSMGWSFDTLVVKENVVLIASKSILHAVDAKSGRRLWNTKVKPPFSRVPSIDILVINGIVWTSPRFSEGRELRTGKIKTSNNLTEELVTAGHHHRCYRNKATERYIIEGWRGLEFRDTIGDNHYRHNWIRGLCQYGIMPANGLVYLPPHNCGCYSEAKLFGFWALKAEQSKMDMEQILNYSGSLEKGQLYGQIKPSVQNGNKDNEWPVYRHGPARSGITTVTVPDNVSQSWKSTNTGRISAPVIANNTLIISSIDTHQVIAYDSESGNKKWFFNTGGPVDSAPTIYGNLVIFGSADGYVYCLSLSDGKMVWRFRGAPMDLKTISLEHIESIWPIHGSILIKDDTAYFVSGRSSYIDGGLFLYGLNPHTGELKYQNKISSEHPGVSKNETGFQAQNITQNIVDYKTINAPDKSDSFTMQGGNISDILVADDEAIYLRYKKLNKQLQEQDDWSFHIFSTSRFLDDNEVHRSHMFYSRGDFSRIGIAYEWLTRKKKQKIGFKTPFGKLLIYDQNTVWGVNHENNQYNLFSQNISNIEKVLEKDYGKIQTAPKPQNLIPSLSIHPRAMIKAGDALILAGYPLHHSILNIDNRKISNKGILLKVSPSTGQIISKAEMDSAPIFDGIAAAYGKLYISCENGTIICLK